MKKFILVCLATIAMCLTAKTQDTIVTIQGKAYLSIVTKIDNNQVYYTRYPKTDENEEMTADVHSLREIRFYDGRSINFSDTNFVIMEGTNVVVDPVRYNPPSYYIKANGVKKEKMAFIY